MNRPMRMLEGGTEVVILRLVTLGAIAAAAIAGLVVFWILPALV